MVDILRIIEKDGLATPEKIAEILGRDTECVKSQLKELKENKIISGYKAVVNWDKYDKNTDVALIRIEEFLKELK